MYIDDDQGVTKIAKHIDAFIVKESKGSSGSNKFWVDS